MDRLITQAAWMIFILLLCCSIKAGIDRHITAEHQLEGAAKARFLAYYHGLDVTPEDARHFQVVISTYDLVLKDINVFTK